MSLTPRLRSELSCSDACFPKNNFCLSELSIVSIVFWISSVLVDSSKIKLVSSFAKHNSKNSNEWWPSGRRLSNNSNEVRFQLRESGHQRRQFICEARIIKEVGWNGWRASYENIPTVKQFKSNEGRVQRREYEHRTSRMKFVFSFAKPTIKELQWMMSFSNPTTEQVEWSLSPATRDRLSNKEIQLKDYGGM